jgi:hypothetical protein
MRTIQRGTSPDLAVLYLCGEHIDDAVREALGPGPTIVMFDDAVGLSPAAVALKLGVSRVRSLVICGYSAGCQAVRAAIRSGSLPIAERIGIVAIDGTHASIPPEPWQLRFWQLLVEQARRSEKLFVATCTAQVYTESLPPGQRFLSTLTVLRQAIDATLAPPDERHEGDLHVYAYASKSIDVAAHIAQQRDVLPAMLAKHVRPWLARAYDETMRETPTAKREPLSLGERALDVMREKLGEREEGGENRGAVVRWALASATRLMGGHEVPLGVLEADWCAGTCGAAEHDAALPGESLPPWRGAVWELVRDALEASTWRELGSYAPQPGDLAVFGRAGEDPRVGGRGHVGRVARVLSRTVTTIDGNVNDAVREVEREVGEVLGWIVRTGPVFTPGLDVETLVQARRAVAFSLDGLARGLG